MARGPRIKLTLADLSWNISAKEKEKLIKTMFQIIDGKRGDPSIRDLNGATKNVLLMCAQDIDIGKHEQPAPESMVIRIEEIAPDKQPQENMDDEQKDTNGSSNP